jgi:hypothetical protein
MPRGVNLYDEAIIQGQLWTPDQLPNLSVWLDSADLFYSDGTAVQTWKNKGTQNNATQSDSTKRPIYKSGILNGMPGVRFDGTNDCLTIASLPLNTFMSMFVVAKTTTAKPIFIEQSANAANNPGFYIYGDVGDSWNFRRGIQRNNASYTSGWFGSNVTQVGLISKSYTSGRAADVYKDGFLLTVGSFTQSDVLTDSSVTDTLNIFGRNNGASVPVDGDLHELIIYNQTIDASARLRVEGHLAWKWGLRQSLNPNHPYINRPPMISD